MNFEEAIMLIRKDDNRKDIKYFDEYMNKWIPFTWKTVLGNVTVFDMINFNFKVEKEQS
jgi:hypothetical protein